MVGYTNVATFKPGNFCYIVVYSLTLPSFYGRMDFLEGTVIDVDKPPVPKSIYHLLWKFWGEKPELIRSIAALATADSRETQKNVIEPVVLDHEPSKDYLVVTPEEHDKYLYNIIERQSKMNRIQQARIRALEERVEKYTLPSHQRKRY